MALEKSAANTADFLLFMDKLFDSVNGAAVQPLSGKLLRVAITANSTHLDFWEEAMNVLNSIQICDSVTGARLSSPPTFKNWVHTLKGLRYIWTKLKHVGFKFLCLRNINQDALENLFGNIRANGFRDNNPTCSNFSFLLKNAILNNFISPHSPFANCEEDNSDGALMASINILQTKMDAMHGELTQPSNFTNINLSTEESVIAIATKTYVAGYVAKRVYAVIKYCVLCKKELFSDKVTDIHAVIQCRSYSEKSLCFPSTYFSEIFRKVVHVCKQLLPSWSHRNGVCQLIKNRVIEAIINNFSCAEHDIFSIIVNFTVPFFCKIWAKHINNILKGKVTYDEAEEDRIKLLAHKYYMSSAKRRRRITV